MSLFDFPVKRRVSIAMLMAIVVVVGLASLMFLKIDLMPKIEFPNVIVITPYDGAAPQEVEKTISKPLEAVLRTVSGIKNVKSSSQEGTSLLVAEFGFDTNLDTAISGVREKVSLVEQHFPEDVDKPLIMKLNLSEMPIMFLYLTGDRSLAELQMLAEDVIGPELNKVKGVANTISMGGRTREIQVHLNKDRLLASGLQLQQVAQTIRFENVNISGGVVTQNDTRFTMRSVGEFAAVEDIEKVVVGHTRDGAKVMIRDVGEVIDTYAERKGLVRVNEVESIGLMIRKESDANLVEVAARIHKKFPAVKKLLPEGLNLGVTMDMSEIISDSVLALRRSSAEGAVLVVLILLIFLGSLRPTLIVSLSIPISMLAAFTCMYYMGFTLNIMTLGALLIALGKLVDDSIVVMENIERHLQMGYDRFEAAVKGTSQIFIAVLGATIATVIVFLPLTFSTGMAGQLFKPFGMTVFFALAASFLVAFTLVPMLSTVLMKDNTAKKSADGTENESWFRHVEKFYRAFLVSVLNNKLVVLVVSIIMLAGTGWMTSNIGKEFVPNLIAGMYQAKYELPVGTSLEATDKATAKLEKYFMELPDVESLFVMVGVSEMAGESASLSGDVQGSHTGTAMLTLDKSSESKTSKEEVLAIANEIRAAIPTVDVNVSPVGDMLFGTGKPIELKVEGNDMDVLRKISEQIVDLLSDVSGVENASSSFAVGSPEIEMAFNHDRLSNHALLAGQVASGIRSSVQGVVATRYAENGDEFDVRVKMRDEDRQDLATISELDVWSPKGYSVPLRDFMSATYVQGPGVIKRDNGRRVVTVSADISERSLSEIVADIQLQLPAVPVPPGYRVSFGGQFEDMQESFVQLGIVALLALLLVYMILAALYESFLHPLTIMVPIPFAVTGGIVLLYLSNTALGVTAFIGFIMLIGIVATNSIVLVDMIIENQANGMSVREAVVQGSATRLRPILMTFLTTGLGMLPVALGYADGIEMHIPLGRVVVGGLVTSTLLTLLLVPSTYEVIDKMRTLLSRKESSV